MKVDELAILIDTLVECRGMAERMGHALLALSIDLAIAEAHARQPAKGVGSAATAKRLPTLPPKRPRRQG